MWLAALSLITESGFELQMPMPMPMHMFDMWLWLALFAAIVVIAITLAVYFSTRPRERFSLQAPPPVPIENPNPSLTPTPVQSTPLIEEHAKPATRASQLRKAMETVRPTLTDDERRILNEIVKAGGEILQSDLPVKSDFSKATVSKLVKSLETMGIVTREKHKWTYWVRLSDKLVSGTKNA